MTAADNSAPTTRRPIEDLRVGVFVADTVPTGLGIDGIVQAAQWAESAGLDTAVVPYVPWSHDAMVTLGVVARETTRIELATAVVPTYPFHPQAMARAALSVSALAAGRLTLGIGPSHQSVIESLYGMSYDRPGVHTREYVRALLDAFAATGNVEHRGEFYSYGSPFSVPDAPPAPGLLVAALAPYMLKMAGELTDGTILWLADEHAVENHVVPTITAAAAAAGRPAPRVALGMPMAICDDVAEGRARAGRIFASYSQIPTYRRILDRGTTGTPESVLFVGPEAHVRARLERFAALGVTDVFAAPFGWGEGAAAIRARTRDFLASLTH